MMKAGFFKRFSVALLAATVLLTACGQRTEEGDEAANGTPQFNENGEIINSSDTPTLGAAVGEELTVRISSDRNFIPTGGSDVATVTAYVTNEKNQAVADQPVEITSDGGVLQSISASTDENGEATAVLALVRDYVNQDITVNVQAGDSSASVVVQAAGTAVSVTGDNAVDAGQKATVTATLVDGNALPIANRELRFASGAGNLVSPETAFTDTLGQVSVSISTDRGDDEITVSAFDGTVVGKHQFTIVRDAAQSIPLNVRVTSDRNFIATGGEDVATIKAFVTNLRNQAVAGREVQIQSDGGVLQGISSVTDENGEASATLSLAKDYRNRTISVSVSVGDYRGEVDVQAAGTRLDISGASSFLKGESSPFTATLTAGNDTPVANQTVRFAARSGSTFSPATAVTNTDGEVTTTVTKATAGDDEISVSAFSGTISGLQTISVVDDAEDLTPFIVRVTSDRNVIPTGGDEQATIRAYVTDKQNQAVAGQALMMSSDGGVLQNVASETDENGEATATLSLAQDYRNRTIEVSVQVGTISNSVSVESAGTGIDVDGPASIVRGEDASLAVRLVAANGEAISNQAVQFSAANGTAVSASSDITDANGGLVLTLSDVTQNDEITVSAYGGGVVGSHTFVVVDDAEELTPYSIRLTSSRNIIPTGGDDSATITAFITDDRNQAVSGQSVELSSDGGVLTELTGTTNDNGEASATLSLARDYRNRPITVRAVIGTVSTSLSLQAAGTGITLSGPASAVVGTDVELEAVLYSGNGEPIGNEDLTFRSAAGNSVTPVAAKTDQDGRVVVSVSTDRGEDNIQVSAIDGTVVASHALDVVDEPAEIAPLKVRALTDKSFLRTGTTDTATITVLITNDRNQVEVGQELNISSDGGVLSQISQVTDENGEATAQLALEPGFENKKIFVTAEADGVESDVELEGIGSQLSVTGPASLVTGDTARLVAVLTDGAGEPIVSEELIYRSRVGNIITATQTRTDGDGRVEFDVETNNGSDTVLVSALNGTTSSSHSFNVANDILTFPDTTKGETFEVNVDHAIAVEWTTGGVAVQDQPLLFSTTAGTVSEERVRTNDEGFAIVSLRSPSAGRATLSVEAEEGGDPATRIDIEFVADTPDRLALQSTSTRVQTESRSKLIARVVDEFGNPVSGERVVFSSEDLRGGQLTPASATTQSDGRATIEFVAGSSPTAENEIVVNAAAASAPDRAFDDISLIVVEQQLNVTLGTSNQIETTDASTQYEIPFVVQVADGSGVPLENAEVVISLHPIEYSRGSLNLVDEDRNLRPESGSFDPVRWEKFKFETCPAEDENKNRLLDENEIDNGNEVLDPQDPALIVPSPSSTADGIPRNAVVTDERGSAYFQLVYPKSNAQWATVEISVSAQDLDAEAQALFVSGLPILAADALRTDSNPPNRNSPYNSLRPASNCVAVNPDDSDDE